MTVKLSIILNRLCRQIIDDFSLIKQSGMLSKGTNTFPLSGLGNRKNGMMIILQFDDWHLNK